MANWFVTGETGNGKTLFAVRMIQDYLEQGRRVATNLDIHVEHMLHEDSKMTLTRLPDKPNVQHLNDMGIGYPMSEKYNEKKFGLLVLDECLTWLNSRNWQDKERMQVLQWFLHSRKRRWDIVFILQKAEFVDPQVRDNLLSYHVKTFRLDRMKIPIIGKILPIKMPRCSLAVTFAGYGPGAILQDREIYKGHDLFQAYDTEQIFSDAIEYLGKDGSQAVDMRASYTVLSPWHIKGRYKVVDKPKTKHIQLSSFEKERLADLRRQSQSRQIQAQPA